ncbi:MAG TPA: YfbM family protein [Kofleriaceae bacterium]|nr:YfbM family protein [Kofleriaceae bacterium]
MTLGVHFALSVADRKRLLALDEPDALLALISEDLEETYLANNRWSFQLDKAWNALHRSLTDGRLLYATGPFPLAYAVLGGAPLDVGDDYTACLVEPAQVAKAATALAKVTEPWLRKRYFALDAKAYGAPLTPEDFAYTWTSFQGLPGFFARAAKAKRSVLFSVDC